MDGSDKLMGNLSEQYACRSGTTTFCSVTCWASYGLPRLPRGCRLGRASRFDYILGALTALKSYVPAVTLGLCWNLSGELLDGCPERESRSHLSFFLVVVIVSHD